jgi:hypothetical protein
MLGSVGLAFGTSTGAVCSGTRQPINPQKTAAKQTAKIKYLFFVRKSRLSLLV